MEALEARQDAILARLGQLKDQVAAYKQSLGLPDTGPAPTVRPLSSVNKGHGFSPQLSFPTITPSDTTLQRVDKLKRTMLLIDAIFLQKPSSASTPRQTEPSARKLLVLICALLCNSPHILSFRLYRFCSYLFSVIMFSSPGKCYQNCRHCDTLFSFIPSLFPKRHLLPTNREWLVGAHILPYSLHRVFLAPQCAVLPPCDRGAPFHCPGEDDSHLDGCWQGL